MLCGDIWKGIGVVFCLAFTVLLALIAGYIVKYYMWMERDSDGNLKIHHDIEKVDATHWALGFAVVLPLYVAMILLVKMLKGDFCCCCSSRKEEPPAESDLERAIKMSLLRPQEQRVVVNNHLPSITDPLGIYYPTMARIPPQEGARVELLQ